MTGLAYPLIDGRVEDHQREKRKQIANKKVHPVDVEGDVQVVAPQVCWVQAVYRDVVLPVNFCKEVYLPESVGNTGKELDDSKRYILRKRGILTLVDCK